MPRAKKVVLFGRTGDGKSTVANALVVGGVVPVLFKSSDAARGCTCEIQKETGRGWTVTDTVGLGEAETGTISNTQAKELLTQFLRKVKDEYSHIIFVQRANRVTVMDEMNWLLFKSIFEGAEDAFVILFTSADENWLDENEDKLPKYMAGIRTLAVDIPPISSRKVTEKRQKVIRDSSIQKLEHDLEEIFKARGYVYSAPTIARLNDAELEEKSSSLMDLVVEAIKRLFDQQVWLTVASKLASLVSVVDLLVTVIDSGGN
ncbi:unnamed protein product [Calypogeia fissa]